MTMTLLNTELRLQRYTQSAPIVLCDDDDLSLRILEIVFKRVGLTTISLPDPVDALDMARTKSVSLIVTDMWKNGTVLNGLELLGQLRSDPDTYFLPVMFLSADNSREITQRAYQNGANAYLFKPYQVPHLIEVTHGLLLRSLGQQ
jgi:two-component system, chemotaxis family, chemotaxis protein CheY